MALKLLIVACFLATLVVSGDANNIDINSLDTCAEAIENDILGIDLPKVQTQSDCEVATVNHMSVYRHYKESCYQFRHELKERLLSERGPIMQMAPEFCKASLIDAFRTEYLSPTSFGACVEDIREELLLTKPGPDCKSYESNQIAVYRKYKGCFIGDYFSYVKQLKQRLLAENGPIMENAPTDCRGSAISAFNAVFEEFFDDFTRGIAEIYEDFHSV